MTVKCQGHSTPQVVGRGGGGHLSIFIKAPSRIAHQVHAPAGNPAGTGRVTVEAAGGAAQSLKGFVGSVARDVFCQPADGT